MHCTPQDMSQRLVARVVRAAYPDWKVKEVNAKAAAVQDAISKCKNGMLSWHAATPQVREHEPVRAWHGELLLGCHEASKLLPPCAARCRPWSELCWSTCPAWPACPPAGMRG